MSKINRYIIKYYTKYFPDCEYEKIIWANSERVALIKFRNFYIERNILIESLIVED